MRVQKGKTVLLIAGLICFIFISCRDASSQKIRIVMIGDSLTAWGDWSRLLNREDIANQGVSGDTTEDVLERMEEIYRLKPQMALVMIGINDIMKGREATAVFSNYRRIIQGLLAHHIKPVIQSTLFLSGDDHRNETVAGLNHKLRLYAQEQKLPFLDLNKRLSSHNQLNASFTSDGLHLNSAGYRAWGKEIQKNLHLPGIPAGTVKAIKPPAIFGHFDGKAVIFLN
jgi:lysophospholipase L1-like esterase